METNPSKALDTLARVDERTQQLVQNLNILAAKLEAQEHKNEERIDDLKQEMRQTADLVKRDVKDTYVTKDTFVPVQKIVYGVVSVILLAVVVAIVGLVVTKK